jgi:hypothetical protein
MSCLAGLLERGVHTTIISVVDVCDVDEHQLFCGRKGLSDAGLLVFLAKLPYFARSVSY